MSQLVETMSASSDVHARPPISVRQMPCQLFVCRCLTDVLDLINGNGTGGLPLSILI